MSKNLELKLILSGDGKQLKAVTTDAKGNVRELGTASTKATGKMRKGMKSASRSVSGLSDKLGRAKSLMIGFAGVTGGAAVIGLTAMVSSSNETIDSLAKMSDKMGFATKDLASLQYAADLTGVSVNTTNKSLQNMIRVVSEAAQGTGLAVDALKELGLDAQHLNDIGPDKAFKEIAEAMKGVKNQSDKVRIAIDLFGARGADLINTLALGADGLNEAAAEADAFGLAVSRVDAAKIEAANDAMTKAQSVATGFGNSLAIEVAPYIEAIATGFADSAKEAGGFGNVAMEVIENVATGIGVFADGLHGIDIIFTGLKIPVNAFGTFVAHIFRSLDHVIVDILNKLPGVSMEYSSTLDGLRDTFVDNTKQALDELNAKLLEPLPSEQIKTWMAEVKETAEQATIETAAVIDQRNAGLQVKALEHSNVIEGIATDHGKSLNKIAKEAAEQQINTREQFTQQLVDSLQTEFNRRKQILDNALDGELISHDQYARDLANQQQSLQDGIARVNDNAADLYRSYLVGLSNDANDAAGSIASSMKNAAGSMTDSFRNAARLSQDAINSIQRQQYNDQRGVSSSNSYDGRNREITGYTKPQGFGLSIPVFNEARVRVSGGGLPTEYFHGGGIVGKDIGGNEVDARLLKGEGVFTQNQMNSMAPVHEIIRALANDDKQSPAAFNTGIDDFLAEYARINAKHIENFDISAIQFNQNFLTAIESIKSISFAPAASSQSFSNNSGFTSYGDSNNQQPNQRPETQAEISSFLRGIFDPLQTRYEKTEKLDGLIDGKTNLNKIVQILGKTEIIDNNRDPYTRAYSKLNATKFSSQGSEGSNWKENGIISVDPMTGEVRQSKQVRRQQRTPGDFSPIDNSFKWESSKIGTIDPTTNTNVLRDQGVNEKIIESIEAFQQTLIDKLIPAQTQPSINGGTAPTTDQQNPIDLFYGGLQPLENFVDKNKDAQLDIMKFASTANRDITKDSNTLWGNVGADLASYVSQFDAGMLDIVSSYISAIKTINSQSIEQPTFQQSGGGESGESNPGFDVFDPSAEAPTGWRWTQSADPKQWIKYFHTGGIVGLDPGGNEVDTRLLKGEGVFTPNQMSALAPVSMLGQLSGNGNNVQVHVHEAANTQTQVQQTEQPDGSVRIDIIAKAVEGQIIRNMQQGRGIARPLQQQYNLRRGG